MGFIFKAERTCRGVLVCALIGALAGCKSALTTASEPAGAQSQNTTPEAVMARIEGAVIYRERMLLPPEAVVRVELQDVSRAGAAAEVIASVDTVEYQSPPIPFALEYDSADIDARHRYSLRATISAGGQLMFTSDTALDPFAREDAAAPIEIMVRRVEARQPSGVSVEGVTWRLEQESADNLARDGDRLPTLLLDFTERRASGFAGCNQYTGSVERQGSPDLGSPLEFGMLAATRRACPRGMALESAYLETLSKVTSYRVDGGQLLLLEGSEELLRFSMAADAGS